MKVRKIFSSLIAFSLLFIAPMSAEPHMVDETYSVVVMGGGIGALTSSIYLARAGYKPIVIEGELPGGAIALSHSVQNWPGELDISGDELMQRVHKQAEANGVVFLAEKVVRVDFSNNPVLIETEDLMDKSKHRELRARACIIALGAQPRFLNVEGEKLYWNRGVYHCAVCDGALFKGKEVAVVGGGDTAILEAEYLSNLVQKVHLILRGNEFRTVERERLTHLLGRPNVQVHYQTNVEEVLGDGEKVTGLLLQQEENLKTLNIDGIFLAIGSTPTSELFKGQLELDDKGYIKVKEGQETSIDNVFAIGDVADPIYKQAISAAGDGAKAAMGAERRLNLLFASASTVQIPASPTLVEIESVAQFEQELKEATTPVIVDFYADWCPPCKRLSPQFEKIAKLHAGKIKFLKVNIDRLSALATAYNIKSVPTVIQFDQDGKVQEEKSGYYNILAMLDELDSHTAKSE